MNPISKFVWNLSAEARKKRAKLFCERFEINEQTKILDLGSENGTNIYNVLKITNANPKNIYIADIDEKSITAGKEKYGFNPVFIDEKMGGGEIS